MRRAVSSVFLNVPFDEHYEDCFLALVVSVLSVGRLPRCVLEMPEHGAGRLARLLDHIEKCDVSVHDLSRVGSPARFNMPFELGLACAVAHRRKHAYILLERKHYRLDRTLSDLKGRDPYIYGGRPRQLVACMLDALVVAGGDAPTYEAVIAAWRELGRAMQTEKRRRSSRTVFTPSLFRAAVVRATALLVERGVLQDGRAA